MHDSFPERVLRAFASGMTEELWWRLEDGELIFFASCSDVFHRGLPDVEQVNESTIDVLEQAASDLLSRTGCTEHLGALFAARVRRLRPHGLAYQALNESLWDLFDACGPVRSLSRTNPQPQPARS